METGDVIYIGQGQPSPNAFLPQRFGKIGLAPYRHD
jgi:hypothetical protein